MRRHQCSPLLFLLVLYSHSSPLPVIDTSPQQLSAPCILMYDNRVARILVPEARRNTDQYCRCGLWTDTRVSRAEGVNAGTLAM
jgi:hypothetical protein